MENMILAAIATLVASVNVLTDFFKRLFKIDKKWVIELMSWVIAIAATYVAWIMGQIPAIFQPEWLSILFEGLLVGIAANIAHGYEITKKILDFIFSFINKTKKAE
jgi:hypothetical protein